MPGRPTVSLVARDSSSLRVSEHKNRQTNKSRKKSVSWMQMGASTVTRSHSFPVFWRMRVNHNVCRKWMLPGYWENWIYILVSHLTPTLHSLWQFAVVSDYKDGLDVCYRGQAETMNVFLSQFYCCFSYWVLTNARKKFLFFKLCLMYSK